MIAKPPIYDERAKYSAVRLKELGNRISALSEASAFPALTIYGVGSYARLEASVHSDIDLFFLHGGAAESVVEPRTKTLRLFGKIIENADAMSFPKFSNDCEYLTVLYSDDILKHLGGPTDDHTNYFTARMLLLLESHCLFGQQHFDSVVAQMVGSYFRDYPDHRHTFHPTFLINDICRYWKTLLLNYENRRNLPAGADEAERKTRQKVRNFKLKFSRMMTCFASVATLSSRTVPVTEQEVVELTKLTPCQRLDVLVTNRPTLATTVGEILERYAWFLEMTGLPAAET